MLGVMIHGAIRNVTVSVKMGVRGISWAWERRGGDQRVLSGCFSLLPNKVGETDNSITLGSTYGAPGPIFTCEISFLPYNNPRG